MHGSREKGHPEIRHHWNTSRKYKDKIVGKAYLYHHVLHSQAKRAPRRERPRCCQRSEEPQAVGSRSSGKERGGDYPVRYSTTMHEGLWEVAREVTQRSFPPCTDSVV